MGAVYARAVANGALRHRARLSAVCDTDAARGAALAAELGAESFTSVDEMLAAGELDAVYLAVPDAFHRDPALACIAAGVPTLLEKPLATSVEDALAIHAAAAAASALVDVNFSNRWNPPFVLAREAIRGGEIGDVIGINARLSNAHRIPESMPWASTTTTGWFLLSHVVDLAFWLGGSPARSVYARGRKGALLERGIDTYDLIHALVGYENGASGVYEAAWRLPNGLPSPVDLKFQLIGTKGMFAIDTTGQTILIAGDDLVVTPGVLDWTEARLHAFLDKVESGVVDDELLTAGLENTRLLVALHRSIAEGHPVEIAAEARS
jgi:predicted dehydrogenase